MYRLSTKELFTGRETCFYFQQAKPANSTLNSHTLRFINAWTDELPPERKAMEAIMESSSPKDFEGKNQNII